MSFALGSPTQTSHASDCVIRTHFRDVSDCYNAERVDEERLQRQVLCPRVPVSWFRNLEDASLDLLPTERFEPWVSTDVVQNPIEETVDPRRYCQIAVAAVIMGDLNAACAVEAAHRRQLLSVGSLQTRTMLMCFSPLCHDWRRLLRRPCHSSNGSLSLPNVLTHCTNYWVWWSAFEHEVWGGQLDGKRGMLGFGMER